MNTDLSKCLWLLLILICIFFSLSTLVIAGVLTEDSLRALVHLSTHSVINFCLEDEGEVESVLKQLLVRRKLDKRVLVMGVRGKW